MPRLDEDSRTLLRPLAGLGIDASPQVWSDPAVDWDRFDLVVVRCCWDYHERRDAFLSWADAVGRVMNPPAVLSWNTDKHYLRQLERQGYPLVPTGWVQPGDVWEAPDRGRWVIKPSVSLAGLDTGVYDAGDPQESQAMLSHVGRLLGSRRTVMVQPYQTRIGDDGETSLIYFDGKLSHAVVRSAALSGPDLGADHRFEPPPGLTVRLVEPTPAQRELGECVLDVIPQADDVLYTRVDLVPDDNGNALVMEVELTEPQLYLGLRPEAAPQLAEAIAIRVAPV